MQPMLELKDFVAETLKQLIEGIVTAQEFAKQHDAKINPRGLFHLTPDGDNYYVDRSVDRNPDAQPPIPQFIEFDVAVTASGSGETKAAIGVFSAIIGAGTQAKIEEANLTVSRIRFSVPVQFPRQ